MKTVKVPELEELAARHKVLVWTDEMDAIIKEYYYRVPAKEISKVLCKRFGDMFTESRVHKRASKLGLRRE